MKKFVLSFALLLAATELFAQTSYVPPTQVLRHKGHQFLFGGDVFQTSKHVDHEGTSSSLPEGMEFTRYQGEFVGQYGATDDFQLGVGARFRYNESSFINANGDTETTSSSGIQSTFATFHYAFPMVDRLQYTLEGMFLFNPYTNKEGPDEKPVLGDDGNEYSAGLGVTYAFRSGDFFTVRGGYRKPGQELSSELYWQGEGALVWRYVALIAGVDGVTSMKNDPYDDEPTERPQFNTGTTALYSSTNREWIAPYVGLNFALGDKWRMELRGSQVVHGRSTDLGTTFGFQLVRRVEDKSSRVDQKFKAYDIEVSVTKVSPKKKYVIVDKGLASDVRKGMVFDFFEFDYVGGNVLIARGTVIQTKADTAIVKITHRFNVQKDIKKGIVGRASLK